MTWLVPLLLLCVVVPLLPDPAAWMWYAHLPLAAALVLCAVPRLARTRRVRLGVPVLATLVALASLAVAVRVDPATFGVMERWWGALTGLAHALVFLALLVLVPGRGEQGDDPDASARERRTRLGLSALLLALLITEAVVVLARGGTEARPAGTLGNPNFLGVVVGASMLALAGLHRWRRSVLVGLSPLLLLLLVTRSRGALLATGLVLLLFLARRSWRTALAVTALGILLLTVVPNPLWERIVQLRPEDTYSRPFLWREAWSHVVQHPLGTGPNMYKYLFPFTALDPEHPWLIHQRHAVGLTHNVFLTLALEWGWVAGLALAGLAVWVLARLFPRGRPDPLAQGATLGACTLFVGMQGDGLAQNPVVFTLFLVLAAVAVKRLPGPVRGPRVPGVLAATVLLLGALLLGEETARRAVRLVPLRETEPLLAAWRAAEGVAPEEDDEPGAAAAAAGPAPDEATVRAALDRAEAAAPGESRPARLRFQFELEVVRRHLEQGVGLKAVAPEVQAARRANDRARRASPLDAHLTADRVELELLLHRRRGRDKSAFSTYAAAMAEHLAHDPLDSEAHWQLAREAQRAGRPDLMDLELQVLFELEPDDAEAWFTRGALHHAEGELEEALYDFVRAEEALHNAALKAAVPDEHAQAYYEHILEAVDRSVVRQRIAALRRRLYL